MAKSFELGSMLFSMLSDSIRKWVAQIDIIYLALFGMIKAKEKRLKKLNS